LCVIRRSAEDFYKAQKVVPNIGLLTQMCKFPRFLRLEDKPKKNVCEMWDSHGEKLGKGEEL
jgi:hypothetical protein